MQSQWDEDGVGEVGRGEIRGEEPSMTVSFVASRDDFFSHPIQSCALDDARWVYKGSLHEELSKYKKRRVDFLIE